MSSAGTWACEGERVVPSPQWMANNLGLDLAAHRSRPINSVILSVANLIIVMESGQQEALHVEFPEVAARVFLLSEICGAAAYDIPDPAGLEEDEFLTIGQEIISLIDQGWQQICDRALKIHNKRL